MSHNTYLHLALKGHRAPIGAHLVLHEKPDPEAIMLHGESLGSVILETADRFATPMAIPLMDLKLEKEALLGTLGVAAADIPTFHFDEPPEDIDAEPTTARMDATCKAIAHVAQCATAIPMGMCIGPFSLMCKLVADPITPVYLKSTGANADEEEDIDTVERCLAFGLRIILKYIQAQINAGARAIIVCEPAANMVYFSPNQLNESYEVFDQYVMAGLRQIRDLLARHGVDFILHDCGELTDGMVQRFGCLRPSMLSLGSSRVLWEDARLLPKETVLYGNLPSKRFYSAELSPAEVERAAIDLVSKMKQAAHPFILGSECDILSVPGSEDEIASKVYGILTANRIVT